MFSERKVAQMAAYFLMKSGGHMNVIKLITLMYLADRQHYKEHGFPISDDDVVAMPYGPALSRTLGLIEQLRINATANKKCDD